MVVSEEAGTVTFTITRSGDLSGTSTVDHAATSGTATAGTDFTALSGTSTFVATTATIDVTYNIIDDAVYESPETFVVTLSNATNAVIVDTTATATIVDRIDLNGLDGTDGFRILGFVSGGYSGDRVSGAGDVNGDGFADLIISAYEAQPGADLYSGAAYVVFGSSSPAAFVDLGTLGSGGVTLDGADANDQFGRTVSAAGDINGDGYGDFIIGASKADGSANGGNNDGEATVIFGDATGALPSTFDTSVTALDGTDGFILYGVDPVDLAGFSVASAGDINGDGYDDLIVGAHGADGSANGTLSAGEAYIVFGGSTVGAGGSFNLSGLAGGDGSTGFVLYGTTTAEIFGSNVSSVGDVNGDGIDDLIVSSGFADSAGANAGGAVIVFGKTTAFAASDTLTNLATGGGFEITGSAAGDKAGKSAGSAGDVDGDGFDDLIFGAGYTTEGGNANAGAAYVIFGGAGLDAADVALGSLGTAAKGSGGGFTTQATKPGIRFPLQAISMATASMTCSSAPSALRQHLWYLEDPR